MWKIFTPADGSSFDKPDAILGPVCKNAVEPALRYAEVHNVSVITPGAQGAAFDRGDGFSERVESRVMGKNVRQQFLSRRSTKISVNDLVQVRKCQTMIPKYTKMSFLYLQ